MQVVFAEKTRRTDDGKQYWRIVAVHDSDLTKYDITGADVDGMADDAYIDAGSMILTPSHNYMVYSEAGHFEEDETGGGGGGGGTTNYNSLSNKPQINGVVLSGNKTSADLNITGSAALSEALTASKAVGGVPVGKQYAAGTSLEVIFNDMLNPVENPTLTNPSATISASGLLVEEGVPTEKVLTVNFNRGSINPAYGTSGYRAGAATSYALNGGSPQPGNTFTVTVQTGNSSFTASVAYGEGEQPKNSAGENYSSPLPAGSVNSEALNFEIVAPLWSNQGNITTVAKEPLISKSARLKQFNFPAQTQANPEVFDVPSSWTVTGVELLNTLSGQWADCSSEFSITDVTHGSIAYKRYTYNEGLATGARSVRVKWN